MSTATTIDSDEALRDGLLDLSAHDVHYWDYESLRGRSRSHDYYQYPAMMVPAMLSDLMKIVADTCPNTRRVYDPFVGSGTVQTEAMAFGLDFLGCDINPLAVLLCRAKAGPFLPDQLEEKSDDLLGIIDEDASCRREANFGGLNILNVPVMMRIALSTPHVLDRLNRTMRPYSFVLSPMVDAVAGYPAGVDPEHFTLITPFTKNREEWLRADYV